MRRIANLGFIAIPDGIVSVNTNDITWRPKFPGVIKIIYSPTPSGQKV